MKKFNSQGFTLLELMIVVGIAGVITAIATPKIRVMLVTNEIVETVQDLRMSLKLARSQAITRGQNTIVCSSLDGSTCSLADGNWDKGWIVGVDLNANGQIDEAQGELIWVHQMDSQTQLTIVPTAGTFGNTVTFKHTGLLSSTPDRFEICSGYTALGEEGFPMRTIDVSIGGEPVLIKHIENPPKTSLIQC